MAISQQPNSDRLSLTPPPAPTPARPAAVNQLGYNANSPIAIVADNSTVFQSAPASTITYNASDRFQETPPNSSSEMVQPGTTDFDGLELNQLVDIYAKLTKRTVLRSNLPAKQVVLNSPTTPITKSEAIKFLELVLATNDVSIVPIGDQYLKAIPSEEASHVGNPVSQADDAAKTDLERRQNLRKLVFAKLVAETSANTNTVSDKTADQPLRKPAPNTPVPPAGDSDARQRVFHLLAERQRCVVQVRRSQPAKRTNCRTRRPFAARNSSTPLTIAIPRPRRASRWRSCRSGRGIRLRTIASCCGSR